MEPKIIAIIVAAVVLIGGYLMIRRAPTAKWMIIVLMFIILASGAGMLYIQNGASLFARHLPEQRIAYVNDDGKQVDIWTMKLDGSDKQRVTNDPAIDRCPAWSSDGNDITSVSDRLGGKFQVLLSSWDGQTNRIMTTSEGTKDFPCFTHDGKDVMYLSSGYVYTIDRSIAGDETQILPPGSNVVRGALQGASKMPPFIRIAPSATGEYLLCVQDLDQTQMIYALETPGGQIPKSQDDMKMLAQYAARQIEGAWSCAGNKLAASLTDNSGVNSLVTTDLDSMDTKTIFSSKGDTFTSGRVAWSPDSSRLVYEYWTVKGGLPDKCQGLYVAGVNGEKPVSIVSGDTQEPRWTADGKYVVYTKSRQDGKRDIWRVNSDGSDAKNLTAGKGDNYDPACSPMPPK
jgi:Tol biopolymer transport system component